MLEHDTERRFRILMRKKAQGITEFCCGLESPRHIAFLLEAQLATFRLRLDPKTGMVASRPGMANLLIGIAALARVAIDTLELPLSPPEEDGHDEDTL